MLISEALRLLGLTWYERDNQDAIRSAWKRKLKEAHPDKNSTSDTTKTAQKINEAKDVLWGQFENTLEKELREAEEERLAREKEQESKRKQKEEENEKIRRYTQELYEKAEKNHKETYMKNRKKRVPGSRVHRKLDDYPEGRAFIEEMKVFFKSRFTECQDKQKHLFVSEIMTFFMQSRDQTSDSDKRLFQRHANNVLKSTWPNAKYVKFQNKRCFMHVKVIEKI